MPEPPKRFKDVVSHPQADLYWNAMKKEMDDLHPSKLDIHKEFQDKLFKKYELRSMGQLNWFLGIRVVRDISQQSTWLIQDAFIDKVAHKYNLMEGATTLPDFPMAETNLEPNTVVDKALKKRYQQLVGSLAYISVFTRPDISLTHSISPGISTILENNTYALQFMPGASWSRHAISP
ncbi:Retrovirus Pol polyprotein from transposon TNT 1-94 [Pyrenophora tritici-repentis]|nr:Retrovirus Pol polyprotein from transposon TNT 1-94 [Pyrenophora tritici-repentis]